MKTDKKKEKEQKKAKKKIASILSKLKKAHEKYEEIQDAIDKTESILEEFGDYLPSDVKEKLQKVIELSDKSPKELQSTFDTLNKGLEFAKNALPGSLVPASAIAGIGIAIAVASIVTTAYFMAMVDVEISNVGCPIIKAEGITAVPTDQSLTIHAPIIQANIDGTTSGIIRINNPLMHMQLPLPQGVRNIQFDEQSIIGNNVDVDLSTRDKHSLIISCR